MTVATDVLSGLLMMWFGLLFVGFERFCGKINFKSIGDLPYIILELVLILNFVGNALHLSFVIPMMCGVLLLWGILQFRAHWVPFLFGAPDAQIRSYYDAFGENIYIFPRSDRRVVPDAYHTILHALMFLNAIAVLVTVFR